MKLSTEIYTRFVKESKQFYCQYFGFRVKQEMEGFVVLQHTKNPEYELLFCEPNSPFVHEIFYPEFQGKGVLFQMEVNDVEKEFERLQESSLNITLPLIEEPVNGKHFTVTDPSGIIVDIVEFKE